MKNKFLITIAAAGAMLTSCNMDLNPQGTIPTDESLTTLADASKYRNGFYSSFRSFTSSGFFTYPEIQCDKFNGLVVNGNRGGTFANGNILSNISEIDTYWYYLYNRINNINLFLEYAEPLKNKFAEAAEEDNLAGLNRYIAEARFLRAYYYAELFDRWCVVYSADIAEKDGMGVPVVTEYYPTADRSKYPGRGTMKTTLDFIKTELQESLDGLLAWEAAGNTEMLVPMAEYLSSDVVKALQARLALWIGDYQTAFNKAKEVIDTKRYPLCELNDYANMWTNDTGTEILFLPYESTSELGAAIGGLWLNSSVGADYIPTPDVEEVLASAGEVLRRKKDVRYDAVIGSTIVKSAYGNFEVMTFNKFPGNPTLMTSSTPNYVNKPKPFRTSELYMIAAEAAYNLKDNTNANKYLNEYMAKRVRSYESQELSSNALIEAIQLQRSLELIGEGFRMSDLRRWKHGFNRANGADYADNPEVNQILTTAGLEVVYTTTDHRYTWPIPSDEISVNPQMQGQQNPGY